VKASEKPFLKFLQGTNQFRIPIYQRTYVKGQRDFLLGGQLDP
jgi:uncharacterized protein with ParB-like and HNH nuclease domain